MLHPLVIFDQFKNLFRKSSFQKWTPSEMCYKNKQVLQITVAAVLYNEMVVSA
jgi:hypothetical protein